MTRRTHPHPHGFRSDRGFSLIEIAIVMGVIGVIVGLVLVIIPMGAEQKGKVLTKTRLAKAAAGMREVNRTFGAYAPERLAALARLDDGRGGIQRIPSPGNDTNEGGESLVQAVYAPGMRFNPQLLDDEFVNTDGDFAPVAVSTRKDPALVEVSDAWGNAAIYIPASAYVRAEADGVPYETQDGRTVRVRPWRDAQGHFEQPDSFQLFSMGPDGEPNTEDDIKHWRD